MFLFLDSSYSGRSNHVEFFINITLTFLSGKNYIEIFINKDFKQYLTSFKFIEIPIFNPRKQSQGKPQLRFSGDD